MKAFALGVTLFVVGCGLDPNKFNQYKYNEGQQVEIVGTDLTGTVVQQDWAEGFYFVQYWDHIGVRHRIYINEKDLRAK